MRVGALGEHSEPRDAISHDWIRYLDELQLAPILIPNALHDPLALVERTGVQALIWTGGGDVPEQGDSAPRLDKDGGLELLRDRTERSLVRWALDSNIPVLGVCRGMQFLNVYFGGGLIRDFPEDAGSSDPHVGTRHKVEIIDPKYRRLIGSSSVMTNSFHQRAVTLSTLSAELRPFAQASGEIVEGLYHPHQPLVGIQWHPERPGSAADADRQLIKNWLTAG